MSARALLIVIMYTLATCTPRPPSNTTTLRLTAQRNDTGTWAAKFGDYQMVIEHKHFNKSPQQVDQEGTWTLKVKYTSTAYDVTDEKSDKQIVMDILQHYNNTPTTMQPDQKYAHLGQLSDNNEYGQVGQLITDNENRHIGQFSSDNQSGEDDQFSRVNQNGQTDEFSRDNQNGQIGQFSRDNQNGQVDQFSRDNENGQVDQFSSDIQNGEIDQFSTDNQNEHADQFSRDNENGQVDQFSRDNENGQVDQFSREIQNGQVYQFSRDTQNGQIDQFPRNNPKGQVDQFSRANQNSQIDLLPSNNEYGQLSNSSEVYVEENQMTSEEREHHMSEEERKVIMERYPRSRSLGYDVRELDLESKGYRNYSGVGWVKLNTAHWQWDQAKKSCEADGGQLVVPDTLRKIRTFTRILKDNVDIIERAVLKNQVFVGVYISDNSRTFITVKGETFTPESVSIWFPNEPNDADPGEDCVTLHVEGKLRDVPCFYNLPFLCQII